MLPVDSPRSGGVRSRLRGGNGAGTRRAPGVSSRMLLPSLPGRAAMPILPLLLALSLFPALLQGQAGPDGARGNRAGEPGAQGMGAQLFMETFSVIRGYALDSPADSLLWERAILGLLEELDDPYAALFSPEEVAAFEEETTGNYAGIGVQISELNDVVTITGVFRGTPAEGAGLQVGDVIAEVDGDPALEWTTGEVSQRIRGEPGTRVEVTVRREGLGEPIRHELVRARVHVSSVVSGRIFGDIGYIALDRVARGSAMEVDSALVSLGPVEGLVIDLRQNPGGILEESLFLGDLFLEPGLRLAAVRGKVPGQDRLEEESWDSRTPPRLRDLPIVILVDRFTASAAEIFAGALQDHDRALVLGERTFGKGVVQTVLPLSGGRQIRLTTGEWFTPRGRGLHRPRDQEGTPIEDSTAAPVMVTSTSGRPLRADGGIFPDLAIAPDTLRTSEREFLEEAARLRYPLAVRIQETAFEVAQSSRAGPGPEGVDAERVDPMLEDLVEVGLDPVRAQEPEIREYLRWRTEIAMFQRLARDGRSLEARALRDPVLTRAVELLKESGSPADLLRRSASGDAAPDGVREAP